MTGTCAKRQHGAAGLRDSERRGGSRQSSADRRINIQRETTVGEFRGATAAIVWRERELLLTRTAVTTASRVLANFALINTC